MKPSEVDADYHPSSLSFHPGGRFAYVTCSHGAICQYRIGQSGQLIPLSPGEVYGTNNPMPLRFDLSAHYACVVADGPGNDDQYVYVYRVNKDGTLTLVSKIHTNNIEISAKEIVVRGNRVIANEYAHK